MRFLIVALLCAPGFGEGDQPTRREIETAYRSKYGEGGILFTRWERRRIKEVRGWKLHFKRVAEEHPPGLLLLRYAAVARKGGTCAEYRISQTIPVSGNAQIQEAVNVDPEGVKACP